MDLGFQDAQASSVTLPREAVPRPTMIDKAVDVDFQVKLVDSEAQTTAGVDAEVRSRSPTLDCFCPTLLPQPRVCRTRLAPAPVPFTDAPVTPTSFCRRNVSR